MQKQPATLAGTLIILLHFKRPADERPTDIETIDFLNILYTKEHKHYIVARNVRIS